MTDCRLVLQKDHPENRSSWPAITTVFASLSALLTFPVELVFQPYCGAIDWLIHLTGIKGSPSSLPMLSHSSPNGSRMRPRCTHAPLIYWLGFSLRLRKAPHPSVITFVKVPREMGVDLFVFCFFFLRGSATVWR